MTEPRSIYEQALGAEQFARLHPMIQRRFGFDSRSGLGAVGRGTMGSVWHGRWYTLPFLWIGTWRAIMFPERGHDVPFTIQNYAYKDCFGRECVSWLRTFEVGRRRRFDAYMIYSEERGRIVDYLGTHQHLAVDIDMGVAPNGGIRLRSGEQRFYEGAVAFRFPMLFSGVAEVCEWYDDEAACFRIEVTVSNRRWGRLSAIPAPSRWSGAKNRPRMVSTPDERSGGSKRPLFYRPAALRGLSEESESEESFGERFKESTDPKVAVLRGSPCREGCLRQLTLGAFPQECSDSYDQPQTALDLRAADGCRRRGVCAL